MRTNLLKSSPLLNHVRYWVHLTDEIMKLSVTTCKPSKFENSTFFEATLTEVTEHFLLGKKVYARFSKQMEIGYTFEIEDARIVQVETKTKADKGKGFRKVWVLK